MAQDAVAALIARMDAQRTRWVPLSDGKRVQIRRPLETEMREFIGGIVTVDHVCRYTCGWEGFTEADLLGAAIGSSDAVPFDAALWSRVVRDKVDYVPPVAQAIVAAIDEHLQAIGEATKN